MTKELLKKIFLFKELEEKEMDEIIEKIHLKKYKKSEILFWKGDLGDALYIIKKGKIKITELFENGREKILTIFTDGDFLGEMAIIDGEKRSASAEAIEESEVYVLYKKDFLEILQSNFVITMEILQILSKRVRYLNKEIRILTFGDVYERFMELLIDLSNKYGKKENNRIVININLTHMELAN
ncbi:MAG: hypothetical protein B6I28_04000, partial [Fusobacteriia bacterium 4572_132]